jgi:hypothetical protein
MIESIEEFRAELQTLRFRHTEFLTQGPVENVLPRTDQNVTTSIAESESRRRGECIHVKPEIGTSLAAGQVPIPKLIRTGNTLRAGIGRVIVNVRREWKTAGQRINAPKVSSS